MFNSGILDVIIGLVVVYLQLSLVCTAINELIASWFNKRANELEKGLLTLLTKQELVDKFYDHQLIKGLTPGSSKPHYIPSRTFALTLMDIIRRHSFDGTLNAAKQVAAERTAAVATAQTTLDAAIKAVADARDVSNAAAAALAAAGVPDKPAATKAVQDAKVQQAAAEAAKTDAQARFEAATAAKTLAESNLTSLTQNVAEAKRAETDAVAAEKAFKEAKGKSTAEMDLLKEAATEKRRLADEAAEKLAPSAGSLVTEARDRVANVQSDVVPPRLKTALLALMDQAGSNLDKTQANLEQWFNDAMDRVSGVYKRKSQVTIVTIAFVVSIFANVDSLQIADSLSRDKALRESLVAAAPELAKADKEIVDQERAKAQSTAVATPTVTTPNTGPAPTPKQSPETLSLGSSSPTPTATPTPGATPTLSNIKASLEEIKKFGVPLGYIRVCTPAEQKQIENGCPNKVDTAVMQAEEALKHAQDDVDKATAALQTTAAEVGLTKALEDLMTATKVAGTSGKAISDELLRATTALLQADRELANKGDIAALRDTLKTASDQLVDAKRARDQATKTATDAKEVESRAITADAKAQKLRAEADASPGVAEKEQAAVEAEEAAKSARREADNNKEMLRVDCPKCRKESELSPSEMNQRLPTSHGYRYLSKDWRLAFSSLITDCWSLVYSHWLGWLLTAMAISLGAPFWFDTLNRLMVIRSTIKPHEKSREQESKDNPDDTKTKT